MKKLLLPFLLMTFAACSPEPGSDEFSNSADLNPIVGGRQIRPNEDMANWVVMVRATKGSFVFRSNGICTGAFISEDVVLTSAHCLTTKGARYDISYGVNALDERQKVLKIDQVLIHPDYAPNPKKLVENDIALIKIKGTKPRHLKVFNLLAEQVAGLPKPLVAIGFGANGSGAKAKSGVLRVTKTQIQTQDGPHLIGNQLMGQGICQGDSGGPLLDFQEGTPVIVGVNYAVFNYKDDPKSSDECHRRAAYISVIHHLPWIQQALETLSESGNK